jgi:polyisoprenyl-phosphate glycosyltransferase
MNVPPDESRSLETKNPPVTLSIVTPCYDEEDVLPAFYARVVEVCRKFDSYELVLVDDGSTDGTWSIICSLVEQNPHVVGVRLSRNHGHQLALTAGLAKASGNRTLIIDADLQDPPELLVEMMGLMDGGADVVYGQRRRRSGESAFKLATAHIFYRLLALLTNVKIPADTGDFRLISRRVLLAFNSMPEHERFIRGMISWLGFVQVPLVYDREVRAAGRSKYPFRKMLRFALDAVTSFSTTPLRIASYLGLLVGVLCLFAMIYMIGVHYLGYTVQGWTSLIVVILFVGALQLFVLGIIGEYLGRLFIESKGRPLYTVSEVYRTD